MLTVNNLKHTQCANQIRSTEVRAVNGITLELCFTC